MCTIWGKIKKLTWLQVFILGDVRVIWCNSLGDCLFQICVMNFVEIVIDFSLHITSHVSQVFASCTHYTCYSLLNSVHVIVCNFGLVNQVWRIPWILCKMCLKLKNLKRIVWNLNFGKIGFKTSVFEKHLISYSCILFIKHDALRSFCIKLLCFFKIFFFRISIDRIYFSTNRNCD